MPTINGESPKHAARHKTVVQLFPEIGRVGDVFQDKHGVRTVHGFRRQGRLFQGDMMDFIEVCGSSDALVGLDSDKPLARGGDRVRCNSGFP